MVESIEGYEITKAQKERMIMVRSHLDYVTKFITELDEKLDKLVNVGQSKMKNRDRSRKLIGDIPLLQNQQPREVCPLSFYAEDLGSSFNAVIRYFSTA